MQRHSTVIGLIAIISGACGVPAPSSKRTVRPAPTTEQRMQETIPSGRLPADVVPEHYHLRLQLLPDSDDFQGEVAIHITLKRPRQVIWLHGLGMQVQAVHVHARPGGKVGARWRSAGPSGVAGIELDRAIGPGRAEIRLRYVAKFDTHLAGLYRVKAKREAYAFTQFQPTYARTAFPCFDEPAFKTPFDVSLIVRQGHRAVANTPELHRQELADGLVRIRFATTARLPTYLLAWAVGPLDVVEAPPLSKTGMRKRKLPLRGFAVKGKGAQLAFALKHTGPILEALERYVGRAYPYQKLDVIAVPDFAAGAMENVGAITFREQYLLLDSKRASQDQILKFYVIMAHELAHQWFGNLVTMVWWHDTWLNEAFATWLASRIVDEVRPDLKAGLEQMLAVHHAMQRDSLTSARRIRQPILSDHDIRNAFDPITYHKGAAVLAMFENWLGEDVFQQGLRDYLKRYEHGNARTEDLLTVLSSVAEKDVAKPFRTFLHQSGLPLLSASVSCQGQRASLSLKQSRYLSAGSRESTKPSWEIPVCVKYGGPTGTGQECFLMTESAMTKPLQTEGCPRWVMPNARGAGYYRWDLQANEWRHLAQRGWRHLSPAERASYGESLQAGFFSGGVSASATFQALEPLAKDDERAVAYQPVSVLEFTRQYLVTSKTLPHFSNYVGQLYRASYQRLGWESKPGQPDNPLLRMNVIRVMTLIARDASARKEAEKRAHAYLGFNADQKLHPDVMAPELRAIALAVAMQSGGKQFFDAVLAQLARTEDATLRQDLVGSLGFAVEPTLASQARGISIENSLRGNEMLLPLVNQMNDPEQRHQAWTWIQANIEVLLKRVPEGAIGTLPWLTRQFCDPDRATEVREFFEPRINQMPGGPRHLIAALESIRLCASMVQTHQQDAQRFFERTPRL